MTRGDVVTVRLPHASGQRGKRRPAVVVQSDAYRGIVRSVILAEVTSNLALAADPACLLIEAATPEGQAAGIVKDSVVSCLALATVYTHHIDPPIGALTPALLAKLDACLRAALSLP